ncbi:MAG: glycosyltransferase [Aphanocapsa sp. GSE-SYN-MK-11-07L]|nr:glycosyltransferase [Aphanocapsa sp. GSE-SYN-MK-11-07L]
MTLRPEWCCQHLPLLFRFDWTKPMSPLCSLIMTVYNRSRYFAAAIESVLAQTYV